ncbi:probable LRR receptor-like serine/threonine-protein kinase At2g16250 isoform X2 [Cryptomeria japonica]|uniref:probable LRR receptor-like serine/threonine-protein kinase At2g16250 isoform X2 n=1 Tax=Cryptomeria japonica TaxID=3369 RepID=UPI0025AC5CAC|nr:probable LRR receptor-like serine/threonine-protein kinase At2g16250 isoform X2 [Cryptomeria japonica]
MISMAHLKWWAALLLLLLLAISLGVECKSTESVVLAEGPGQQEAFPDRVERAALFNLRSSLGLRSREWPKKVNPCTTWKGIECNAGRVVGINLSGFRRTVAGSKNPRFAVEGLQNLTFLQEFNASGFALPGSVPSWFGQLTALITVDLSSASVNGELPPSLGNLSNLNALVLSRNNITGTIPSSLGQLSRLTILDLSFNNLTGTISLLFANLKNLTMFDLSSNKLQGQIPNGIGNLTKLARLKLASNNISGDIPNQLGDLSLLDDLDLSSNALSASIPKELGKLKNLTNLVLSNNNLQGPIPEEIFNCTALQIIRLDQNNLTNPLPSSIKKLVNIRNVSLSHNQFYGTLPPGLTGLRQLVAIDFSNNFFENKIPNGLSLAVLLDEQNCLQGVEKQRPFKECESFYSARKLSFSGFAEISPSLPPQTTVESSGGNNKHLGAILGGVFGGLGFVLLVIVVVYLYLKYERKVDHRERDVNPSVRRAGQQTVGITVNLSQLGESFGYEQLSRATEDFSASHLLKNGHSGDLYQGLLEGGVPIVVKRIALNTFKKDGYLSELDILGRASHTRLVPLLGHCLERDDEKLLVYKYMPNRDLSYALYKKASSPEDTLQSLDWITRLKIAIGAAEGLSFLHHECAPPLVHRDVQASSILLDDKFEVRLGSLTEACPQEGEAPQSVLARILRISQTSDQGMTGTPIATCAYDVYCFGKVLMELVSGKLGISGSNDPSAGAWLDWALPLISIYEKESVTKIVDPSLIVDEDLLEEVWAMAIVAKSCLNPKPSKRPLMRYILKALENPLKVVREDNANASARLRTSSRGSWNAALFGSWRHSSSEIVAIPGPLREEYTQKGLLKQAGTAGSQGSGQGGDVSSHKRLSNEIFPEPMEEAVVPASSTDIEKQDD